MNGMMMMMILKCQERKDFKDEKDDDIAFVCVSRSPFLNEITSFPLLFVFLSPLSGFSPLPLFFPWLQFFFPFSLGGEPVVGRL